MQIDREGGRKGLAVASHAGACGKVGPIFRNSHSSLCQTQEYVRFIFKCIHKVFASSSTVFEGILPEWPYLFSDIILRLQQGLAPAFMSRKTFCRINPASCKTVCHNACISLLHGHTLSTLLCESVVQHGRLIYFMHM